MYSKTHQIALLSDKKSREYAPIPLKIVRHYLLFLYKKMTIFTIFLNPRYATACIANNQKDR